MPYLICPSCALNSYSAAAYVTADLCPRCDRPLRGAERAHRPYELVELGASIAPALKELPERERRILRMRFIDDMTQSEIAAQVGVSQMHISRLIRRSLERMRDHTSVSPSSPNVQQPLEGHERGAT